MKKNNEDGKYAIFYLFYTLFIILLIVSLVKLFLGNMQGATYFLIFSLIFQNYFIHTNNE